MVGKFHAAKPGRWTWVLLHGLGSSKGEWDGFAERLAAIGDGAMVYDARGHGDSIRTLTGEKLDYQEWQSPEPWGKMPQDLDSAVEALHEKKNIALKSIAVGGASLGANVAMIYASRHNEVPAVVLLSPGLQYAGVSCEEAFKRYGKRRLFIGVSPGDAYAFSSVQYLASLRGDAALRLVQGPGAAHGVHMFEDSGFTQRLLDWIKTVEG